MHKKKKMSSNAYKRTVSLCYMRFKRGAPCVLMHVEKGSRDCTVTRATVVYQQIVYGNIANQIHRFTIDYGTLMLYNYVQGSIYLSTLKSVMIKLLLY